MRLQFTQICTCNSRYKSIISYSASSYPCYATAQHAAGNFKRTASKPAWTRSNFRNDKTEQWHRRVRHKDEEKRLHPLVHKYTILIGTLLICLAYTLFSDCKICYNISHYKYFLQNLIVLLESWTTIISLLRLLCLLDFLVAVIFGYLFLFSYQKV